MTDRLSTGLASRILGRTGEAKDRMADQGRQSEDWGAGELDAIIAGRLEMRAEEPAQRHDLKGRP